MRSTATRLPAVALELRSWPPTRTRRLSVVTSTAQCAAVSTQSLAISEPPQKEEAKGSAPRSLFSRLTIQGQVPAAASVPPMMRLSAASPFALPSNATPTHIHDFMTFSSFDSHHSTTEQTLLSISRYSYSRSEEHTSELQSPDHLV